MTNQELDALMQRVLLDSIRLEYDRKEDNAPFFTPTISHQRQMKSMLNNPLGWLRKRERPLWKIVVQRVATILLVISLGVGCVMATSPTVRATVVRWVTVWYENHITYWYSGENTSEKMPRFRITDLPEGYVEVESEQIEEPNYISVIYRNGDGDTIYFDYTYMQQGSVTDVITEDIDVFPITVNGLEGHLYLTNDPDQEYNTITWIDPNENIQFSLDAPFDQLELLHLAESVSIAKAEN